MDTQTQQTIDIWHDDLLNRKADAEFLHNFLTGKMADRETKGISGSYVLNIDAEWGAGKTFFLKRFGKYLEQQNHIVVSIDAWRDDYVDDPFVAVLAAIDERLKPYIQSSDSGFTKYIQMAKENAAPVIFNAGKGIAKTLFKKFVGTDDIHDLVGTNEEGTAREITDSAIEAAGAQIDKLTDKFTDQIITKFVQQEKASKSFRSNLGLALKALKDMNDYKLPLFILIDELDRCRPTYAIALLERVKHLFDIDNVVFVFGTNSGQLQHSIIGAYGPSFDGYRYLKRFFDKTYKLEKASPEEFIRLAAKSFNYQKIDAPGTGSDKKVKVVKFLTQSCQECGLDLRDIQHTLDIMQSVIDAWPHDGLPLDLAMLFPLAYQYHKTGNSNWKDALEIIPEGLSISTGFYRENKEHIIHIKSLFSYYYNAIKSDESAIKLVNSPSSNKTQEYAGKVIDRELYDRVSIDQTSRYLTLPSQIERAGQMQEKKLK